MLKDYYRVLEVSPQSTPVEIKKSFRRLAMLYHPDKHDEDKIASAQYREIQEAYDTLTDP
ncbi:MAG: DnaJ domain-containing protein, partial [Chitinophagaceae bacterium]